ncbi:MAG: tRNA pseudouridine(55) synthase TruB [Deltaproteobacteria bacterium]|nr:tRNA pseudouridine(55) synthase TruB [Deltaproteobacteria bacterium]
MAKKPAQIHGILAVDKPAGWTSRDVVNKLGRWLGEREVGHAGTLDPDATGVLLLTIGEAGKLVRWLQDANKTYITVITLGQATQTDDAAGPVIGEAPLPLAVNPGQIQAILDSWRGELLQVPPQVSALQQDGQRDHDRVRRGEVVERAARPVWLEQARVLDVHPPQITLEVTCGAGFYVRSLARDLAVALGTLGHVKTLRRVHAGGRAIGECHALADLLASPEPGHFVEPLLQAAARVLPTVAVDYLTALQLKQGKLPVLSAEVPSGDCLVVLGDLPIAVCRAEPAEPGSKLQVIRGFAWPLPDPEPAASPQTD